MKYAFMEFEKEIKSELNRVLGDDIEIPLEIPSEERGDYAVPCFVFSSRLKKPPQEIASDIVAKIDLSLGTVEQAGPYVNFTIDDEYVLKNTLDSCMEGRFGWFDPVDEKILIEHTSANPNAPLHVGNARNPIIGDTVARIFKRLGYDVTTEYYVDDMGRQVAILTWGLKNLDPSDVGDVELEKPDHELSVYYQRASAMMEEDEGVQEGIQEIIQQMESGDEGVVGSFQENSRKVLSGHISSLERLNITHDSYKSESSLVIDGKVREAVEALRPLSVCGDDEGALYMGWDDHRVYLTRSDGTSLYPARDIAYHMGKADRTDIILDVLGEDHKMHALSIRKAMEALKASPAPDFIFYSFVSLEGEKMSTRSGRSVWLDGLMESAKERAREEILQRREDLTPDEVEDIAEKVGMGAVRFNIIKVQPEKPIDFRWDEALNFQGSSAPFVQYSHARAASILRRWGEDTEQLKTVDPSSLGSKGEVGLVKTMAKYPMVIQESTTSPHLLANYAVKLAAEFHQFYRDYPVLKAEENKKERLAIVLSFKKLMEDILDALGIAAPEYM